MTYLSYGYKDILYKRKLILISNYTQERSLTQSITKYFKDAPDEDRLRKIKPGVKTILVVKDTLELSYEKNNDSWAIYVKTPTTEAYANALSAANFKNKGKIKLSEASQLQKIFFITYLPKLIDEIISNLDFLTSELNEAINKLNIKELTEIENIK